MAKTAIATACSPFIKVIAEIMSETPQTSSPPTTSPGSTPQNNARNNARRAARRKRLQQQRAALGSSAAATAPKTASTAPKSASTAPKSASIAPKSSSSAPKSASSAPKTASVASKTTSSAPKTASAAPKTTSTAPKTTSSAQKSPSTALKSSTTEPKLQTPAPMQVPVVVTSPAASRAPRRFALWAAIGLLGCCVAASVGAVGTYMSWRGGEQIVPNAYIANEPVGGLTRRAARERLQARYENLRLTVRTPGDDYDLPLRELGGKLDVNRAVNDAYWFGRSGSVWQNVPRVFAARFDEHRIDLPVRWDKEQLKERMRVVAKEFNLPAQDATLKVDGGGVRVVAEEAGRALNLGETLARLQKRYHVGLAAIDATVREVAPRLTAADLEGTDVKLEQYTTTFNRGLVGRTRNIRVASATVDGTVLLPGQTFSFNASTGERTYDKGYRMAHIFERKPGKAESEVVDGLAGGVCQVSSTLFNAVRKSNQKVDAKLKIVQRESHSLPVPYVPRGLDATVAWPYRDFKFRNTLPHPIYLRSVMNGSRLTVSVWARVPAGNPLLAKNTPEQ